MKSKQYSDKLRFAVKDPAIDPQATLLRISGAIQVLEELMADPPKEEG